VPVDTVSSGHLSVERATFADQGGVYLDELGGPAGEEYEFAYRLRQRAIPILCAPDAIGTHAQSIDLPTVCRRQFKLGLGTAQVLRKYPHVGEMPALNELVKNCHRITGTIIREIASSHIVRLWALRLYLLARKYRFPRLLLRDFYRYTVALWYIAGLRAGIASGFNLERKPIKCRGRLRRS
jgi:hypothetical protein